MTRVAETQKPVISKSKSVYRAGREPSFTAMWHACLRNTHATTHAPPVFGDTRSVQLVPADVRQQVQSVMYGFSPKTPDAIVLMSVIRHRLLAERLNAAFQRGFRQLVVLGAGLDTTAFALAIRLEDGAIRTSLEADQPPGTEQRLAQV